MNKVSKSDNYQKSEANNYVRLYIDRPDIDYEKALRLFIKTVLIIGVISFVLSLLLKLCFNTEMLMTAILIFAFLIFATALIFLKKQMIWFIKIYQNRAKFETRLRCCYEPSCSEYAILAIQKYGVIKGTVKAIKRLKRCHPPGGIDYP